MSEIKRDYPRWRDFSRRVAEQLGKRGLASKGIKNVLAKLKPLYLRCAAPGAINMPGPDEILKDILNCFETSLREPGAPGVEADSKTPPG